MDAFRLRETIVADYAEYVQSFLAILDPRIRAFVDTQLADGMLWPDPLQQLSPAFAPAERVDDLASQGALHPISAQLFQTRGLPLGPPPPETLGLRAELEDLGYRVYAVRPEDNLDQLARRLSR